MQNALKGRVEVITDFMDDPPILIGNEGKLHQAILNLIDNAQQAITEHGTIHISTRVKNGELKVVIEDDGEGISPEHLKRIADPFFTTKEPGKGTGLGLFITYNIIREHNGEVNVESKPKKGTTFTLVFKLPE